MALEQKVDELLARLVGDHPAAPWFSKVKGTGGEAIGKVIGHIEAFGKFYPVGDPMIPAYVTRLPEMVPVPQDDTDELVEIPMVWVSGIERLTTPSKLIKYAGFVPGQKRKAGELTDHNVELRTMCWRLATSLMKEAVLAMVPMPPTFEIMPRPPTPPTRPGRLPRQPARASRSCPRQRAGCASPAIRSSR